MYAHDEKIELFLRYVVFGVQFTSSKSIIDPSAKSRNIHVDTWVCIAATNSPGNHTNLLVLILRASYFANEWRSTVTGACINSSFTAGANETWVQKEKTAETRFSQTFLAFFTRDHWQFDTFHYRLVGSLIEFVFAPAIGKAALIIVCGVRRWKTCRIYVFGHLNRLLQEQKGNIVEETARPEILVDNHVNHIPINVRKRFSCSLRIPFASPCDKIGGLILMHTMRCR